MYAYTWRFGSADRLILGWLTVSGKRWPVVSSPVASSQVDSTRSVHHVDGSSHGQFSTGRFITQKLIYCVIVFSISFSKVSDTYGDYYQKNIYVIVIKKMSKLKFTRKLCYRKDDRAMRPIHGAVKIFMTPWLRPRLLFPTFFMGFCSDPAYKCSFKIWST